MQGFFPISLRSFGLLSVSPAPPFYKGQRETPTLVLTVFGRFNGAKGQLKMTLGFPRPTLLAGAVLAAMALTVSVTSPARADRCDEIATQRGGAIDGLK